MDEMAILRHRGFIPRFEKQLCSATARSLIALCVAPADVSIECISHSQQRIVNSFAVFWHSGKLLFALGAFGRYWRHVYVEVVRMERAVRQRRPPRNIICSQETACCVKQRRLWRDCVTVHQSPTSVQRECSLGFTSWLCMNDCKGSFRRLARLSCLSWPFWMPIGASLQG